jgi:hypothetical protein
MCVLLDRQRPGSGTATRLSAHPQAFVNGSHHAMLAATIIPAAGAAGTAMLLIPDRSPGPMSHTVEPELAQLAGER